MEEFDNNPRVVWANTVDQGKWVVWVEAYEDNSYAGILRVREGEVGDVIHSEDVSIAYGATFGPDYADVSDWQSAAILAIDNPEKRRGA